MAKAPGKAKTLSSVDNNAVRDNVYLFNVGQQEGFVIVATDDASDPILGYSDRGSIDASDMPDGLREFINARNHSIALMKQRGIAAPARAPRKANTTMAPVKPLVKTYFNQSGAQGMYLPWEPLKKVHTALPRLAAWPAPPLRCWPTTSGRRR